MRGRQRKSPGVKIRNWLFSRSVDPNSALPSTHLGTLTKSWCPAPRHCNGIHLVCGEAVAWHWDFWHFPGDPKVQQSWGTLNWAARMLPSRWCTEPGLLRHVGAPCPHCREVSPLFTWHWIGLQWLSECCLSLKKHFSWFSNMRMIDTQKDNVGVLKHTRDHETKEYF